MRVHKNANYTVMSNHHFRERNMSLKAKGLLSLMLSLPDDWDYSINGLATLSKDGRESVMSALKELEQFGYLKRTRITNEKGHFKGYDYDIFECPLNLQPESEKPTTEKPKSENQEQINTNKSNIKVPSTKLRNIDKAIAVAPPNIFIKELVKSGYLEEDEIFMDQYNHFIEEVAEEHGFQITRSCVMYFVKRATGYDQEGKPIKNKFKYFQESIDFGLLKTSPYYVKKNIPDGAFAWLRE